MSDTANEQKKEAVEEAPKPEYRILVEKDFKFNKPYLVRDSLTGQVSTFTPKEGTSLVKQAMKFSDTALRGLAVAEVKPQ